MKRLFSIAILAISTALLLTACGSSPGGGAMPPNAPAATGTWDSSTWDNAKWEP